MATGSSGYDGLAMGLFGEHQLTQETIANDILTITSKASNTSDFLVLENSAGTEQLYINNVGTIYIRNEVSATAYLGVDARGIVLDGATGTWMAGCGFRITNRAQYGGQVYAGNYHFVGDATANHTGGRGAVINLISAMATGYGGNSSSEFGFINFAEAGTHKAKSLFTFPGVGTSDEIFQANTEAAATHALKCNLAGTDYYIMLTTCDHT